MKQCIDGYVYQKKRENYQSYNSDIRGDINK